MAKKNKPNISETDAGAKSSSVSVYIGPSIKGVIQNGTIFMGSPAEAIKEPLVQIALQTRPGIKALIIDASELSDAKKRINTPGDTLYKQYSDILRNK